MPLKGKISFGCFFILFNIGCMNSIRKILEEEKEKYIGIYILDISKSKLGAYKENSSLYSMLTLTLLSDSSFQFSNDVPFIKEVCGIWLMEGDGLNNHANLFYSNKTYRREQIKRFNENYISIVSPAPKKNHPQVEKLVFRKLESE